MRSVIAAAGIGFVLSATAMSGTNAVSVIARIAYPQVAHWRDATSRVDLHEGFVTAAPALAQPWDLDMRASVTWLHEVSGLTWDQLGRALGVSRRAVHMWATGSRINSVNAEHLNQLVGIVQKVESEHPSDLRAALLAPRIGGRSIFDDFRARTQPTPGNISGTPFTPDQLMDARHDPVQGDA